MEYLMGLDHGGTEIKCAIFDINGNEVSSASEQVFMYVGTDGSTERDAEEIWNANCKAVRRTLECSGVMPEDIVAIGVTGYGNGINFVDKEGNPVYAAVVSTDTRAGAYVRSWEEQGITEQVYRLTRQKVFAAQVLPLVAWFRDHKPEVLQKAEYVLQIKDYIRARLTGTIALEYTDMSNSALLDIDRSVYAEEVFDLTGIRQYRRLFTDRFLESTDHAGSVSKEAAEQTGLAEGTPVYAGLFDIDASCLAAGVTDENYLCIVGGTWVINEYLTSRIEEGEGKMATTLSFLRNRYLISESSATGVGNLNWYLNLAGNALFAKKQGTDRYGVCDQILRNTEPELRSAVFVPYLYSSATRAGAHGAFLNITGAETPQTLLRAVYEGITFSAARHVDLLKCGRGDFEAARLIGGASNSPWWCQLFADILGMRIETVNVKTTGAFGAALCAGVGSKVFPDLQSAAHEVVHNRQIYYPDQQIYGLYQDKKKVYMQALDLVDSFRIS